MPEEKNSAKLFFVNSKKRKALASLFMFLAAALVLVGGTLAWASVTQHALNEVYGEGAPAERGTYTVHNSIITGQNTIPQDLLATSFDYLFEFEIPEGFTSEGIVVSVEEDDGRLRSEGLSPFLHLPPRSRSSLGASVLYDADASPAEDWRPLGPNLDGSFTLAAGADRLRVHMLSGWKATFSNVPIGTAYSIDGYKDYSFGEEPELKTTSHGTQTSPWPNIAGTVSDRMSEDFIEHRYIRGELQVEKEVRDGSGAGADPGREYAFELALRHEVPEGTPVQASPGVRVVEGEGGAVERLAFRARDAHGLQATAESEPLFVDSEGNALDRRLSVAAADGSGEGVAAALDSSPAAAGAPEDGDGDGSGDSGSGAADKAGSPAGAQASPGASGEPSNPAGSDLAEESEGAPEAAGPAAGEWRSGVVLRFTLRHGDRLTLPSLPEGLAYEVRELVPDDFGGEAPYVCIPAERRGTIKGNAEEAVPKADECGFLNVVSPGEGGYVCLAVEKRWVLLDGSDRGPADVTVLVRGLDGELVDQVTLRARESARHGWRHAFTLPKYAEDGKLAVYSLEEAPAEGFAASYSTDEESGATVITNTEIGPDDPNTPDNPVDPNQPDGPDDPTNPNEPDNPGSSDEPTSPADPDEPSITPSGNNGVAQSSSNPTIRRIRTLIQTGDPAFWSAVALFGLALASTIAAWVISRKKKQ